MSGQDGDHAALNRVALGTQTVSVWKDSRELGREAAAAAVSLAKGQKVAGAKTWAEGAKKVPMEAMFLKPVPVTQDNLDAVIKAGCDQQGCGLQGRGQRRCAGGLQVAGSASPHRPA